eukprot:CAMPEP_0119009422 /NCGR_PEP_ID=MMETSP1176-20130426/4351_1 /TAXON_ID=265551 /ORGANISM="Synedropsis recta cf, Strain CCMP1620" /LENGTH=136 /DNA_ID=CAMNT_0006961935 /DNA_START=65 /DNA_END=475 /DNA_ORIENTATION=+
MRTEVVTVCLLAIASQTMVVVGEKSRLHLRRTEEQALLDEEEVSLWGRLLDESSSYDSMPQKGGKKGGAEKGGKKDGAEKGGKKDGAEKGGKKDGGEKGGKKDGGEKGGKKGEDKGEKGGSEDGGYRNRKRLLNVA